MRHQGGIVPTKKSSEAKKKNEALGREVQAGQFKVRLDDSDLEVLYANYANVSGTREEIQLDFGMSSVRRTQDPPISIKITKRITLNPHTAKRLAIMMNQAITAYETKFGHVEITQQQEVPDMSQSSDEVKPS